MQGHDATALYALVMYAAGSVERFLSQQGYPAGSPQLVALVRTRANGERSDPPGDLVRAVSTWTGRVRSFRAGESDDVYELAQEIRRDLPSADVNAAAGPEQPSEIFVTVPEIESVGDAERLIRHYGGQMTGGSPLVPSSTVDGGVVVRGMVPLAHEAVARISVWVLPQRGTT